MSYVSVESTVREVITYNIMNSYEIQLFHTALVFR